MSAPLRDDLVPTLCVGTHSPTLCVVGCPARRAGRSRFPRRAWEPEVNMNWFNTILDELTKQPVIGYLPAGLPAAEPTAIAALALAAHGRMDAARKAADALAKLQTASGAVGIRAGEDSPGWPTSLAIVAWTRFAADYRVASDRALTWLLANRGQSIPRSADFGHNSELVGWAYAENTHSWVEPTALAVLALKAAGRANEPATREGVAMLLDRQLPGGGHNYGNTYVLGQLIRPHVQPTGLALLALRGESDASDRLAKSIAWLRRNIGPETTPLSLGWALLGLKAQGVTLPQADEWLAKVAGTGVPAQRVGVPSFENQAAIPSDGTRSVPATFKLALLALAAKGWPT
jgi:hypothetical protein